MTPRPSGGHSQQRRAKISGVARGCLARAGSPQQTGLIGHTPFLPRNMAQTGTNLWTRWATQQRLLVTRRDADEITHTHADTALALPSSQQPQSTINWQPERDRVCPLSSVSAGFGRERSIRRHYHSLTHSLTSSIHSLSHLSHPSPCLSLCWRARLLSRSFFSAILVTRLFLSALHWDFCGCRRSALIFASGNWIDNASTLGQR